MTLSHNEKTRRISDMPSLARWRVARLGVMACALAAAWGFAPSEAVAQSGDTLSRLINVKAGTDRIRLSPVREATLRASARTLGTQTGLIERAKEIQQEVDKRKVAMEKAFRFGDLVIGAGVLPPVLLHTENAATVTDDTMRLAGAIYEIKQPARFFSGAPSWRDWLLMGLPSETDLPAIPDNEQLRPRDAQEKAFWEQEVRAAYFSGREQAQEIFDHNLSLLEQVYTGMRTFYDLYQRNMVSAPIIAKSQEIITQDDPNTIVVGDTLFRITMPAQFQTDPEKWKALQARPSVSQPIPVAPGFDPQQVKEAYEVYKLQQARRQAELEAKKRGVKLPDAQIAPVAPTPAADAPPITASPSTPVSTQSTVQTVPVQLPRAGVATHDYRVNVTAANPGYVQVNVPVPAQVSVARPLFAIPSK